MRAFLAAVILPLFVASPTFAQTKPTNTLARSYPAPPIRARSAVLLDAQTGQVLASKNAHMHVQIASTTKVMTALLALQLGHLSDLIKVPGSAFNYESDATVMGLRAGETVTLKDLLYGLLLPSGADAANVIAIHYGGSETKFAALMNQKAAQLGMKDTHYVTAHGLDTPGQYSSAYDLALLGMYVSKIPQLMAIAGTRSYNWAGHILVNVNHVLFWYPGVDGIKPGYTYAAGICQLLDAHRDGRHVIVAILDTPDLVIDARNLLNFGLRDFTWIKSPLTYDVPGLTVSGTGGAGAYAYFIGSGHYVRGNFLKQYWNFSRGLPLGFPRTEAMLVNGHLIQYFQNGELEQINGKVIRVPLGATPLPTPSPTPSPTPRPAPSPTATSRAGPTSTSISVQKEGGKGTPTPTPIPPAPTPTVHPRPSVASPLTGYVKAHGALGSPSLAAWKVKGYTLQTFQYGALAYDPGTKRVWMLPVGDRMLAALHYLPKHPGNGYPPGFAPASVLRTIGWMTG